MTARGTAPDIPHQRKPKILIMILNRTGYSKKYKDKEVMFGDLLTAQNWLDVYPYFA